MAQSVIGALRVNLGLDSAQFMRGAQQAQNTMQQFGRRMQVVGAAISAVGVGVALAVRGQLAAADELSKASARIGMPVEALSQLQHAAELSGVSMSTLETGLTRLARNMVDDAGRFEELGISVRDATGAMRPTADVLQDVADRIAAMPEGAERTALAIDLLGRSGADLIPMLMGGSEAIRAMMEEADALGLTISGETAAAAAQFNDNITRLQRTLTGIWRQISAQLAPVLAEMSDYLVSLAAVFQNLSPQTQRFLSVLTGLSVVVGPLMIAVGALVTVLAGISAPVLLAVAAVTAITAAVVAFWPEIVALKDTIVELVALGLEMLAGAFDDLSTIMRDTTAQAVDWVQTSFNDLMAWFSALPERFLEFGRNIIQGLSDGILERWNRVRDSVTGVFDGVLDYIPQWARIRSPSRLFHEFGQFIMQGLANGLNATAGQPIAAMRSVADQMSGPIQNAAQQIESSFESAFVGFVTGTRSAQDAIASLMRDLARLAAQAAFRRLFGAGSGGGGIIGAITGALGFGGGAKVRSYEGGGFTGSGPRTGGLDGRGGMLAMVHPNETVIDHTRGGGGGVTVNIDARGAVEGVAVQIEAAIQRRLPEILQASSGYVGDRRLRGFGA
jgi:hypothetical protein